MAESDAWLVSTKERMSLVGGTDSRAALENQLLELNDESTSEEFITKLLCTF